LNPQVQTYKTAEEWGLPLHHSNECWICGHRIYSDRQRAHGFQELMRGDIWEICSVCLQVQAGINKDCLHKEDAPNSVGPVKRLFLCDPDMNRIAVWEVLDHEPWLKQIQELPSKEVAA